VERRVIELDGGRRLSTRVWAGQGIPVVLLHGLLDGAEGWASLARSLRRPVIAFDLPGFGSSDLPTRPRLSAYADDVVAGLDALGHRSFVLVGHSLGGGVAAAMADRVPERVAALVLLAPAGFGRIALAEAVSVPGVRGLVERALPLALANPLVVTAAYMTMVAHRRVPEPELLQRITRNAFDAVPGAREATRAIVAAGLCQRGFHRRPHVYDGPVRALWGVHDRLVPVAHAEAVERSLPQSRITLWPGMGHHPQRERPDALLRLVAAACRDAESHQRRSLAPTDAALPAAA
jgi:pimeloyl-ACP methyl ester carboxylesterase